MKKGGFAWKSTCKCFSTSQKHIGSVSYAHYSDTNHSFRTEVEPLMVAAISFAKVCSSGRISFKLWRRVGLCSRKTFLLIAAFLKAGWRHHH